MDLNDLQAKAGTILTTYARTRDQADADRTLSAEGKATRQWQAYDTANQQMTDLRQQALDAIKAEERQLADRVHRIDPSDLPSFREALSHADQLTNEQEATVMLQRAIRIGDDLLVRAISEKALESQWHPVIQAIAEHDPVRGEALHQLQTARSRMGTAELKLMFQLPPPNKPSVPRPPVAA